MKVLHKGKPRHYCETPGFFKRLRLKLEPGAIIECSCGKAFQWTMNYHGSYWKELQRYWNK